MIPTRRALLLAALLFALSLITLWLPDLALPRNIAAALLLGALLTDLLKVRRETVCEVQRDIRGSIPVGVWSEVTLSLRNTIARTQQLQVHDHHPSDYTVEGLPRQ
ncbi:MAG: hypothetical protein MI754_03545, partial [Chromatiales bacterium]|nr:hypothetical protein [Chromatiales bacterium]